MRHLRPPSRHLAASEAADGHALTCATSDQRLGFRSSEMAACGWTKPHCFPLLTIYRDEARGVQLVLRPRIRSAALFGPVLLEPEQQRRPLLWPSSP